jgi:hypothetical protein
MVRKESIYFINLTTQLQNNVIWAQKGDLQLVHAYTEKWKRTNGRFLRHHRVLSRSVQWMVSEEAHRLSHCFSSTHTDTAPIRDLTFWLTGLIWNINTRSALSKCINRTQLASLEAGHTFLLCLFNYVFQLHRSHFFISGVGVLVLRPLLAYCTSPRW